MDAERTVDSIASRTPEKIRHDLEAAGAHPQAVEQLLKLHAYAAAETVGLGELQRRTRIPSGTLSQLFSGSYPGNWLAQARRIERFFYELENRRIFGGCRDFVRTQVAQSLWRIFERTRYNRRIQIVQSEEQLGKTRAAQEYAAEHNAGRTILVTLREAGVSNPFGLFLRDLAEALGISTDHKKVMEFRYQIRRALAPCDLVILDEVHLIEHWPDRAIQALLDYLRIEVHDNGARGVVLIATNTDVLTLLQVFRKRSRYNVGQLLGRMCNQVLELYPDEIPLEDVRLLTERYYKASKATLTKLHDIACRRKLGHLGLLDDVLSRAWATAQLDKVDMTDDLVLATAKETLDDLSRRADLYK